MTSVHDSLAPGEEKSLVVYASFVKPHIYDMNRWKLNVRLNAAAATMAATDLSFTHIPSLPHYVTVSGGGGGGGGR